MRYHQTQRCFLTYFMFISTALISCLLLSSCQSSDATPIPSSNQNSQALPKVMTPDWGIAATLTGMGYPPVAMGDKSIYREWVGKPTIPAITEDVGTRYQPNPEMFSQLDLDMVIDSSFYEHLRPMYGDLPNHSIALDSSNKIATWEDFIEPTLKLGQYIGQPQAAQTYLDRSKNEIKQAGQIFRTRYPHIRKLAVVQFTDTDNLRMYSKNSLFEPALAEMGLDLITLEDGNQWGFSPVMLGDLARLDNDTCLVVVEPISDLLKLELKDSLVWQRLGYSFDKDRQHANEGRCITLLPPTWINGGIASMTVLAERLTTASFVGDTDL